MRNAFRIFTSDIKSAAGHFFAMAIIIAISILPALYAWVNIYANGNPYVNTGNIKIAVVSNDPGIVVQDGTHVNMAEEVFEDLRKSDSIDWQFPKDQEAAIQGVKSGKYYAAVIFEDNFTYNMYHFEQAVLDDRPPLTYYENAKKNAVASKITETAASTLQENINTKYLETVFNIVFDETGEISDELGNDSEEAVDTAISRLIRFRDTLDSYGNTIDYFLSNSDKVQRALENSGKELSSARARNRKAIANAGSDLGSAKKTISVLRETVDDRLSVLDKDLVKLETMIKALQGVENAADKDKQAAKDKAVEILAELQDIRAMLPSKGGISGSESLISTLDNMIESFKKLNEDIDNLPDIGDRIIEDIETARTLYKTTLKPGFNSMFEIMDKTFAMLGPFISGISNIVDDIDPVLDATGETVDSIDKSLLQLQKVLHDASVRLTSVIDQVSNADGDERLEILAKAMHGDPELYGAFFSSLVDVSVEEVYQVASYGAAMAPFYSVLAVWVGGVILVSILKTHVDRKKFPGMKEAEYFFGRFLLFFLIGQLQAAVIVAGDIFLLDCAPVHPWLMWLSAAVTSLVFVMLIYALTLSFGDIGKAIVVVIMVLQIAGSSGSYPIEILPVVFSKIYKFFPFPYAINAMREALCGMYGHDYLIYLGELLLFGTLGAVIGLIVRRPFIGVNRFVSEKLEETEVL